MHLIKPPSIFCIPNYLLREYADPQDNGRVGNYVMGQIEKVILVRPANPKKIETGEFTVVAIHDADHPESPSLFRLSESRFLVFDRRVELNSFDQGEPTVEPVLELMFTCDNPAMDKPNDPKRQYQRRRGYWIRHIIRIERNCLMTTVASDPSLDWKFPYVNSVITSAHGLATKVLVRGHWEKEWVNPKFDIE